MNVSSLRLALVLGVCAGLSGCSYLGGLRLPAWAGGMGQPAPAPTVPRPPATQQAAAFTLVPTSHPERWQGLYRQEGTVARFIECRSGADTRVAREGDHALLEAAYQATQPAAGAQLRVEVQGRWVLRPLEGMPPSAGAQQLVLRVERFVSIASHSTCPGR